MKKETIEKHFLKGGIGHYAICPKHGLPALMFASGVISSDSWLGEKMNWVHEKEEEGLSYVISQFYDQPYKEHPKSFSPITLEHKHEHHYKDHIHQKAELGVDLFTYAMISVPLYFLAKRKVKNYFSKSKKNYESNNSQYQEA